MSYYDQTFEPWEIVDGQCVVADEAEWQGLFVRDLLRSKFPKGDRTVFKVPTDIFEDVNWDGPMVNHKGEKLFIHRDGWSRQQRSAPASPPRSSLNMNDVRVRLFKLIDATPHLDWLLLTKRPENIRRFWFGDEYSSDPKMAFPARKNVWIGTTVENQEQANKRIPELLRCHDLSPCLFLSCEPLLGPVELIPRITDEGFENHQGINVDWVIAGGESGPNARPSHPDWYRSLRDQCEAAGVPFHFKQWGEWLPLIGHRELMDLGPGTRKWRGIDTDGKKVKAGLGRDSTMVRVGKKKAGRLLDGVEHNGMPEVGQ